MLLNRCETIHLLLYHNAGAQRNVYDRHYMPLQYMDVTGTPAKAC
jgi:hypothetical protein